MPLADVSQEVSNLDTMCERLEALIGSHLAWLRRDGQRDKV